MSVHGTQAGNIALLYNLHDVDAIENLANH